MSVIPNGPLDRITIEQIERDGGRTLACEVLQPLRRAPDSRYAMTLANHQWHGPATDHTCCPKDDDSHLVSLAEGQQFGTKQ
jgi:hypothetical protein